MGPTGAGRWSSAVTSGLVPGPGWADRIVFLRDGVVVDETGRIPAAESLLNAGTSR